MLLSLNLNKNFTFKINKSNKIKKNLNKQNFLFFEAFLKDKNTTLNTRKKKNTIYNSVQTFMIDWHSSQSVKSDQLGLWFNSIVKPFSTRKHWWVLLPSQNFLSILRWENNQNNFAESNDPHLLLFGDNSLKFSQLNFFSEKPFYFYLIIPFMGCLGLISASSFPQNFKKNFFFDEKKSFVPIIVNNNSLEKSFNSKKLNWEMLNYLNYKKIFSSLFLKTKDIRLLFTKAFVSDKENYIGIYAQKDFYKNYFNSSNFFENLNSKQLKYSSNFEIELFQIMSDQYFQLWWKRKNEICFTNLSSSTLDVLNKKLEKYTNVSTQISKNQLERKTNNILNKLEQTTDLNKDHLLFDNFLFKKASFYWFWSKCYSSHVLLKKNKNYFNTFKNLINKLNYKINLSESAGFKLENSKYTKSSIEFSQKLFCNNLTFPKNYLVKPHSVKKLDFKNTFSKEKTAHYINNIERNGQLFFYLVDPTKFNNVSAKIKNNGPLQSHFSLSDLFVLVNGKKQLTVGKKDGLNIFENQTESKNIFPKISVKEKLALKEQEKLEWYQIFGTYYFSNSIQTSTVKNYQQAKNLLKQVNSLQLFSDYFTAAFFMDTIFYKVPKKIYMDLCTLGKTKLFQTRNINFKNLNFPILMSGLTKNVPDEISFRENLKEFSKKNHALVNKRRMSFVFEESYFPQISSFSNRKDFVFSHESIKENLIGKHFNSRYFSKSFTKDRNLQVCTTVPFYFGENSDSKNEVFQNNEYKDQMLLFQSSLIKNFGFLNKFQRQKNADLIYGADQEFPKPLKRALPNSSEQSTLYLNKYKWKYLGNWSFYWNYFSNFYGSSLVVKPWNYLRFSTYRNKYDKFIIPFNILKNFSNPLKASFITRNKLPDQNIFFQKWHSKNKTGFFYKRITKLELKQNPSLFSNSRESNSLKNYSRIVSLLWGFRAKYKLDEVLQYQKSKYYQSKKAQQTAHQNIDQNSIDSKVSKQILIKTLTKNRRYKRYLSLDVLSSWLRDTLYFRKMARKLVPIKKDGYFFNFRTEKLSYQTFNGQITQPDSVHWDFLTDTEKGLLGSLVAFKKKKNNVSNDLFSNKLSNFKSQQKEGRIHFDLKKSRKNYFFLNDCYRNFKGFFKNTSEKNIGLHQNKKSYYTTNRIFLSLNKFKKLKNLFVQLDSRLANSQKKKFDFFNQLKQKKKTSKIFWRNTRNTKRIIDSSVYYNFRTNFRYFDNVLLLTSPIVSQDIQLDKKKNFNYYHNNKRILNYSNQKKVLNFDLKSFVGDNVFKNCNSFFSNLFQKSFKYRKNSYYGENIFLPGSRPIERELPFFKSEKLNKKNLRDLKNVLKLHNKTYFLNFNKQANQLSHLSLSRQLKQNFFIQHSDFSFKNISKQQKKRSFAIKRKLLFNYKKFLFSSYSTKTNFKLSFFKKVYCFSDKQYTHLFNETLELKQNYGIPNNSEWRSSTNELQDINTKFKNLSASFVIWRNKFHRPRDYFLLSYIYLDYLGTLLNSISSSFSGIINQIKTVPGILTKNAEIPNNGVWGSSLITKNLIKPQWSFSILYHLKKNNFSMYQQLIEFSSEQFNSLKQISTLDKNSILFEKNRQNRKGALASDPIKYNNVLKAKAPSQNPTEKTDDSLLKGGDKSLSFRNNFVSSLISFRSINDSTISSKFLFQNKIQNKFINLESFSNIGRLYNFDSTKQNKNYLIAKNNIETGFKKVFLLKTQQKYISTLKFVKNTTSALKIPSYYNFKYRRKTGIFQSRILSKQSKIYNGIFISTLQLGLKNQSTNFTNLTSKQILFWLCTLLFHICLGSSLFSHYRSSINLCLKTLYSSLFVLNKYFVYIKYRIKRLISYIYQSNFQNISENLNDLKVKLQKVNFKSTTLGLQFFSNYLNSIKIRQISTSFMTNIFFNSYFPFFYSKSVLQKKRYNPSDFKDISNKNKIVTDQQFLKKFTVPKESQKDNPNFLFEKSILGLFQYLKYKYRQFLFKIPSFAEKNLVNQKQNDFVNRRKEVFESSIDLKFALKLFGKNQSFFSGFNFLQKVNYSSAESGSFSDFILRPQILNETRNQKKMLADNLQVSDFSRPSKQDEIQLLEVSQFDSKKLEDFSLNTKQNKVLKQKNLKLYLKILQWNMLLTLLIGESELLAELEPYREMHWYFLKKFPIFLRTPSGKDYLGMVDYQADEKIRVIKQKIRQTIMILYLRSKKYESKLQSRSNRMSNSRKNNIQQSVYGTQKNLDQTQKSLKKKILRQKIQKISPWKSILTFLGKYSFMIRYATLNKRFRESIMLFSKPLISFGPIGIIFFPYIIKNFVSNFDNMDYQKNFLKNVSYSSETKSSLSSRKKLSKNFLGNPFFKTSAIIKTNYFSDPTNLDLVNDFFTSFQRRNLLSEVEKTKVQKLNFYILQKIDLVKQTQKENIFFNKNKIQTKNDSDQPGGIYLPKNISQLFQNNIVKKQENFLYSEKQKLNFEFEFILNIQKLIQKYNLVSSALNTSSKLNSNNSLTVNNNNTNTNSKIKNRLNFNFNSDDFLFTNSKEKNAPNINNIEHFSLFDLSGPSFFTRNFYDWSFNDRSYISGKQSIYFDTFDPKLRYYRFSNNFSKVLADVGGFNNNFSAHQELGPLICKVYTGLFSKEFAKNYLLVSGNMVSNTENILFLVQALAGEIGIKLFMEDAKRLQRIGNRGINKATKRLEKLFDIAQANVPALIFIEDIHVIGSKTKMIKVDEEQDDVEILARSLLSKLVYRKFHKTKSLREAYIDQNLFKSNVGSSTLSKYHRSLKPKNPIPKSLVLYQLTRRKSFSNFFKNQSNLNKRIPSKVFLTKKLSPAFTTNAVLIWKLFKSKIATPNKRIKETPWYHIPIDAMRSIHPLTYSIRVKVAKITLLAIFTMGTRLRLVKDLIKLFEKTNYSSHQNFIVFATTNQVSALDPALRRPGRLEETISLASVTNFSNSIKGGSRSLPFMNILNTFQIFLKNVPGFSKTFNLIDNTLFSSIANAQIKEWSIINYLAEESYYSVFLNNNNLTKPELTFWDRNQLNFSFRKNAKKFFYKNRWFITTKIKTNFFENKSFQNVKNPRVTNYISKRTFNQFIKYQRMTSLELKNGGSQTTKNGDQSFFNYWQILFSNILLQRKKGFFDLTYNFTLKTKWDIIKHNKWGSFFIGNEKKDVQVMQRRTSLPFETHSLNLFLILAYSRAGQNLMIITPEKFSKSQDTNNKRIGFAYESNNSSNGYSNFKKSKKIFDFDHINNLQLWSEEKNLKLLSKNIFYKNRKSVSKIYFLRFFSSKIGELLLKNKIIWNVNTVVNGSLPNINSSRKERPSMFNFLQGALINNTYNIKSDWTDAYSYIKNVVTTSSLYSKTPLLLKLLHLEDVTKPRQKSFFESLNAGMLFEYYDFHHRAFFQQNHISNEETLNLLILQKYMLNNQGRPLRKYVKLENSNRLWLFRILFTELGSLDNISLRATSMNYYYRNKIVLKQGFKLSTYQWWNWHLRKPLEQLEDVQDIAYFPCGEKYYNPRHRRWILTNGFWSYWFSFDKNFYFDLYEQYMFESFQTAYLNLDENREILDYLAKLFICLEKLSETELFLIFNRYKL